MNDSFKSDPHLFWFYLWLKNKNIHDQQIYNNMVIVISIFDLL